MDFAVHGGPDAQGVPLHDFSTNGNACGPCPDALAAVADADATRYPDPTYEVLREQLAALHGVEASRIHMAASGSEFILRISMAVARCGGLRVTVPKLAYADYARAAQACGMEVVQAGSAAELTWRCDPSSPLGQADPASVDAGRTHIVDCAYAPLRLGASTGFGHADDEWQLWTPNKALGLTGVRGAYAIAPRNACEVAKAMQSLMPSWPIGAHAVAMLQSWTTAPVRQWLANSLLQLRDWKASQLALCESLGWRALPSETSFFVAAPATHEMAAMLAHLRTAGIKLRDTASFGLPGHVRLNVMPPASQQALRAALVRWQ